VIALLLILQGFGALQDSAALKAAADSFGVPYVVIAAVAWNESQTGSKLNNYRGPGREQCDSLGCRRVCREVGRMQVNPCIDWHDARCSRDSIRSYEGNIRCGAIILRSHFLKYGSWVQAIKRYNGSGPLADKYLLKALAYAGWRDVSVYK